MVARWRGPGGPTGDLSRTGLNDYKTSAKYKQQVIEVKDTKLKKIIKLFLKHNQSGYFIVSPTDVKQPINSNNLTKVLIGISVKYTGKRVGSSLIRHIYLSEKYGKEVQHKEHDAELMMHSKAMQDGYIKTD